MIEVPFKAFPRPAVKWTHNGAPLTRRNMKIDHIDGMTSLAVSKVQPEDAGKISVQVSNDHGQCSLTVTLSVVGELKDNI